VRRSIVRNCKYHSVLEHRQELNCLERATALWFHKTMIKCDRLSSAMYSTSSGGLMLYEALSWNLKRGLFCLCVCVCVCVCVRVAYIYKCLWHITLFTNLGIGTLNDWCSGHYPSQLPLNACCPPLKVGAKIMVLLLYRFGWKIAYFLFINWSYSEMGIIDMINI